MNIDGGVIDNDPFDLAHDYLARLDPASPSGVNEREALKADRAVITVAPFPTENLFDENYDCAASAGVFAAVRRLFSVLISQSRFFGESLALIMTGKVFSRFMIAPSDACLPNARALQCATLGAFGGFFERNFRAHDYQLGRRNCQQFLRSHFILPENNAIIEAGQSALGAKRVEVVNRFGLAPPNSHVEQQKERWMPLIPLCGSAVLEVARPQRLPMKDSDLDAVVELIAHRFEVLLPKLLQPIPSWLTRWLLEQAGRVVALFGKTKLKDLLRKQLNDAARSRN